MYAFDFSSFLSSFFNTITPLRRTHTYANTQTDHSILTMNSLITLCEMFAMHFGVDSVVCNIFNKPTVKHHVSSPRYNVYMWAQLPPSLDVLARKLNAEKRATETWGYQILPTLYSVYQKVVKLAKRIEEMKVEWEMRSCDLIFHLHFHPTINVFSHCSCSRLHRFCFLSLSIFCSDHHVFLPVELPSVTLSNYKQIFIYLLHIILLDLSIYVPFGISLDKKKRMPMFLVSIHWVLIAWLWCSLRSIELHFVFHTDL